MITPLKYYADHTFSPTSGQSEQFSQLVKAIEKKVMYKKIVHEKTPVISS
jgi:hypothetical protein